MTEQNIALLKIASAVRLFRGLQRPELVKLLSCADKVTVLDGEPFFNEGDAGESFYVIVIGQVVVEQSRDGKWMPLATLKPGDSFGEMTLIDEKVRSARVRAQGDCTALFFPQQRIKPLSEITSVLYLNIARLLSRRLKSANSTVLDLTQRTERPSRDEPDGEDATGADQQAATVSGAESNAIA